MITKGLSRKKIIISMSMNNVKKVIVQSNVYVTNINQSLKDIKPEICANFIHPNNKRIIIITNKVTLTLNMSTIEKYIKNLNNIDLNKVISSRLP